MTQKRMPVAERQQETAGSKASASTGASVDNWPDTGSRPTRKGADRSQVSLWRERDDDVGTFGQV
jgi:hypothetical protein